MNEYIEQLKKMKSKLHSHKMSVLVGAGFSKNVDPCFLSWNELLKDIVLFLFQDEIDYKYAILKKSLRKDDFQKDQVKKIIEREGYIEIVSQFIKRKGFREAIETYVERHTPYVTKENEKLFLKGTYEGSPFRKALNKQNLSSHIKLVKLPWNNIYTTNYDNLLESVIDSTIETKIKGRKEEIESDLILFYRDCEMKKQDSSKLEQEISVLKSFLESTRKFENIDDSSVVENYHSDEQLSKEKLKGKEQKLRNIYVALWQIERNIAKSESERLVMEKILNQCITVVSHSSELKIKRNKNIIKLHGNLRVNSTSDFGFDGDTHKQYVISKEDYETYPQKHEAFTQLMRISLLQESYCLIGFSGTDPNFTSWISWVRDIIERRKPLEDDYKIYLMEVCDDKESKIIDEEKKLFFENHRIVKIPIWEKEIVSFLNRETQSSSINIDNPKQLIDLLFLYLSNEECVYEPQAFIELKDRNQYEKLWENVICDHDNKRALSGDIDCSGIKKLKTKIRVPSINWSSSHHKQEFLFIAEKFLKNGSSIEKKITSCLLPIAIQDSFLTPCFVFGDESKRIASLIKEKDIKIQMSILQLREAVLFVDKKEFAKTRDFLFKNKVNQDIIIYESILFSAFSFDYQLMKKQLDSWTPEMRSHWYLKKLGLLSLFDSKASEEQLKEHINSCDEKSFQEQMYTLEILNYFNKNNCLLSSKKDLVKEKIKRHEQLGFKGLMDNFDYISDELNREEKKLKPYGEGRFSISNSITFSNSLTENKVSIQFIQLLIEFGIPLSLQSTHIKNGLEWFGIFKNGFEHIPYPFLFYSQQVNDEKILRRIGQEYAYSEYLKNINGEVLDRLLAAFLCNDTPKHYKNKILIIASELFVAVPPEKWQADFYKIWQFLEKQGSLFLDNMRHLNDGTYSFITKGLSFVNSVGIVRKIISSIIDNYSKDKNTAIEYLYFLANNDSLDILGKKIANTQLNHKINFLVEQISQIDESAVFAAGNLHRQLSEDQGKQIEHNLTQFNFDKISNERIWSVLLFFVNKTLTRNRIKKGIVNNDKLWHTGINGNSISGQYSFIKLHLLDKKYLKKNGIEWTKTECLSIYKKMKKNLAEIERVTKNEGCRSRHFNFKSILEEMHFFLTNEEHNLENISDYNKVAQSVKKMYYQERGYESTLSALLSNDHSIIIWALSELFYDIYYQSGLEVHEEEIAVLVNKVLLKKEPALEASIGYISHLVENRKGNVYLKSLSTTLTLILDTYSVDESAIERSFLYESMVRLAKILNYWDIQNESIDKWINAGKTCNFNNVISLISK